MGKFLTAPRPTVTTPIKFAFSGDETGYRQPGDNESVLGTFKAFRTMAAANNDFNIDFGDTIYSDPEVPGAPTALGVGEKWAYYRDKLAVKNMQRIRSATGLYNHWDDHEFINDFSIPEDGRPLYNRSVRAFRNYMPVTYSDSKGIYRSFRWGKNLELFFLDERSFRSAKASSGRHLRQPGHRPPDLAPTAPQSTRNVFSALVPSLYRARLAGLQEQDQQPQPHVSRPRPALPVPLRRRALDGQVEGGHERAPDPAVLRAPLRPLGGLRVRAAQAAERAPEKEHRPPRLPDHGRPRGTRERGPRADAVRRRGAVQRAGDGPVDTPYQDFVIGPVGTTPFWEEIDEVTGQDGSGQLISNAFFKPPPPNGMGMACAQGGQNSFAQVTVTRDLLRIDYKDENGNVLLDSDGIHALRPVHAHGLRRSRDRYGASARPR